MKLFLGTNYGHGSAAAVISEGGELLFAVEEGRIIGNKDTCQFPVESLKMIFENIQGDFAYWAEGWNINRRLLHKGIIQTLKYGISNPTYINHRLKKEISRYYQGQSFYENQATNQKIKQTYYAGHHIAHAYSLLPYGLPSKSIVFVSDTSAERESISTYYWSGNEMIHLCHSNYPHSIGSIYHQLAYHLGFEGRTGPGKVMALSAYGEPIWYNKLKEIFFVENDKFIVDLKKYPAWRIDKTWLKFAELQNDITFKNEILAAHLNFENGKNLASSVQKWFTEATFESILQSLKIAREIHRFKVENVGLSGGAALNCQANGEIIRRLKNYDIKNVIISPWSDDSGTAIGAAAWIAHKKNIRIEFSKVKPFLGLNASYKANILDHNIEKAIEMLINGGIIALISGRLEFGPRALGGRCLLADARNLIIKKRLNKMKNRPYFMPFAPAILQEDFNQFFEEKGSPIMAWTVSAKPSAKNIIPAAIHESNEARVQVVNDESLLLFRLLKSYKRKTGFGLLLLTSLNGKGESIPCTLLQSIQTSEKLNVDGILTDNYWEPTIHSELYKVENYFETK